MSFAMGKLILVLCFSFLESHPYPEWMNHSKSFFAIRRGTVTTGVTHYCFGKNNSWGTLISIPGDIRTK